MPPSNHTRVDLDMAEDDIPSEEMPIKARHDPGGKVSIRLPDHVQGTALFGGIASEYRYRLTRTWGTGPRVMFVMMNPSTADPLVDDPTVAKCRRFALKWGYGSMYVGNTFAYRATDQSRLAEVDDPVGPENDDHLRGMAVESKLVIFAYGQPKHRKLKSRGIAVARLLHQHQVLPHILKLSKNGTPCHPLYLPGTLEPMPWQP
jgi:hypothetical protein